MAFLKFSLNIYKHSNDKTSRLFTLEIFLDTQSVANYPDFFAQFEEGLILFLSCFAFSTYSKTILNILPLGTLPFITHLKRPHPAFKNATGISPTPSSLLVS